MCVLKAINAKRAPEESLEFRTWNDTSMQPVLFKPFSDKSDLFHVFELPKRRAAEGPEKHLWAYRIRLGPKASGAWSNLVSDKKQPRLPPLLRKVNWRELMQILRAPNQLGLPTSVNTDSKLGWS